MAYRAGDHQQRYGAWRAQAAYQRGGTLASDGHGVNNATRRDVSALAACRAPGVNAHSIAVLVRLWTARQSAGITLDVVWCVCLKSSRGCYLGIRQTLIIRHKPLARDKRVLAISGSAAWQIKRAARRSDNARAPPAQHHDWRRPIRRTG